MDKIGPSKAQAVSRIKGGNPDPSHLLAPAPACAPDPLLQPPSHFFYSFIPPSLTGCPEALTPKQRVQEGGCSVQLPCRPHSPPVWTCSDPCITEIAQRRHLTRRVHTPLSACPL